MLSAEYEQKQETLEASIQKAQADLEGFEADKSSGERTQEVDIYLKFIGKLDVPMLEPPLKELAAQEALRKKREKRREYSRRHVEEKKLQKQQVANNN